MSARSRGEVMYDESPPESPPDEDPRDTIHRHVEDAGRSLRKAERIARKAGDKRGADRLGNIGDAVDAHRKQWDPANR